MGMSRRREASTSWSKWSLAGKGAPVSCGKGRFSKWGKDLVGRGKRRTRGNVRDRLGRCEGGHGDRLLGSFSWCR